MEFEIRKRRRANLLPFVIAAAILILAVGLYVWKYVLSDQGISMDAEKSLTEGTTETASEEQVIYAGSRRVTADIPEQAKNTAAAQGNLNAENHSPASPDVQNENTLAATEGRKNNLGIVTTEHSDSMNSFLQEIPEFSVINEEPNYALFLISEEGYITAYLGDQTDIYEYTQIPLTSFPDAQQKMLEQGLYMETFADYYDFLESYTS